MGSSNGSYDHFLLNAYFRKIFPKNLATFFKVGLYADIAIVVALVAINDIAYLSTFTPIMALATCFMFYPALQKTEEEREGTLMHYGWLIGVFVLLFMTGAIVFSISGYAIIPTLIYFINVSVGFSVLPVPVAAVMWLLALLLTNLIFPYQNVAILASVWGTWYHFIVAIYACYSTISHITSNKKIMVLLKQKVAYLRTIDDYKRQEELAKSHFQHDFDRSSQSDFYEEMVIPKC